MQRAVRGREELRLDWEVTAFHSHHEYFRHGPLFAKLVEGFDRFPGAAIRERVEAYVLDLGFTRADIATLRGILLEPAQ